MSCSLRSLVVAALSSLWLLGACSDGSKPDPSADEPTASARQALMAEAPSNHYVTVSFSEPVGAAGADPTNYSIVDGGGTLLPISGATLSDDGTRVTLATASQQPTDYQLLLANDLGIGSAGFVGSMQTEPFLDSAVALSDTTVQLDFSERMDRKLAETSAFYRLTDPDTDEDVDIEITGAKLQDDLRTVILTTTPQKNRLYTVQATNVKSRFSCDDGDVSDFAGSSEAPACSSAFRPLTTDDAQARFEITARSAVDKNAPTNPEASGSVGTVKSASSGIGVGTSSCSGNPCAASNGNAGHEELTVQFDVPTRADAVVLGIHGLGPADVVIFVSSVASSGYDYTLSTAQVEAVAVGDGSEIHFNRLTALPQDLMVDKVRVRATNGMSCFASLCVSDGRTVDPTRSVANFWGIPTVDNTAPRLVNAVSTSPTTLLVSFDEPLDSEAADPTNFDLGPDLDATAAVQTEYQTQVLLTTTRQSPGTDYTLQVSNLRDRARNLIDPDHDTTNFIGITTDIALETAIALSATEVLLTFSAPMDTATTENIANYRIFDPDADQDSDVDIEIVGAEASADGRTVVLTTTPQQNVLYLIEVTNLKAQVGEFFIDPSRNTAVFEGIPADDEEAPFVVSAVSASDRSVLVTFNEPLRIEAANPANFSISPDLAVLDAALTAQQDQILLTTAAQVADVTYLLTVSNVEDKARNAIGGPPANEAEFVFDGTPETLDGGEPPRVVGAASTSNTTVVVTFSKAMSDDAEIASNFVIVQQNVNPEVGALSVVEAAFVGDDRTAVQLVTRTQNEVTYVVTVTNVRDRAGNQMAPLEASAGVLVNPSMATFAGTPWSCDAEVTTCVPPDADADGMNDNDEQRGWVVIITLVGGETVERQVSSNPDVEDTDGDGLSDTLERLIGSDPRDRDTDDDLLNDYDEYNVTYTSPTNQDRRLPRGRVLQDQRADRRLRW